MRDRDPITVHLGPTHVTVYRDGYTIAWGAACGQSVQAEFREIGLEWDNTHLRPYSVTCARCKETSTYRDALAAYQAGIPPRYIVNEVPRMKREVYKKKGVYDVQANNLFRQWLGLPSIFPIQSYLDAIMEDERRIYEGHRASRARSQELDRQLAELGIKGEVQIIRRYDLMTGESEEEIVVIEDSRSLTDR